MAMISIDEVISDSLFPTVDFKFHNSGNAASFMHEFHIEVKETTIDKRPSFSADLKISNASSNDFGFDSASGDLIVEVSNNGWGGDAICELSIVDNVFYLLFPEELLTTKLVISGGERKQAFKLNAKQANHDALRKMLKDHESRSEASPFDYQQSQGDALRLSRPRITLSYRDDVIQSQGSVSLNPGIDSLPGNIGGVLYLSEQSFLWHGNYANFCICQPSAVYYSKLDPRNGKYLKKHKISHRIGKADTERFKVMVGAEVSANLKIVFRFLMEEGKVIESDLFSIDIWHPRNTRTPYYYEDGEELMETIEKQNSLRKWLDKMRNRIDGDTDEILFPLSLQTDRA